MNFFFAEIPQDIYVELTGDAKKNHEQRNGHYILDTNLVNNKSSWLQNSGSNLEKGWSAIWNTKECEECTDQWVIGDTKHLGQLAKPTFIAIKAQLRHSDFTLIKIPTEATTWYHYSNDGWQETNDEIKLHPVFYSGEYLPTATTDNSLIEILWSHSPV